MSRITDLIASRASPLATRTVAELEAWQAEHLADEAGEFVELVGPPAHRRPSRWLDAPRFRCVNGHVGVARPCVDGHRCRKCGGRAVLTFPEDTQTERSET